MGAKFVSLCYMWMTFYLQSIIRGLHEVKQCLSNNFDMKYGGEASYVIGVKIHRDRPRDILRLSQKNYINKVLERFRMKD